MIYCFAMETPLGVRIPHMAAKICQFQIDCKELAFSGKLWWPISLLPAGAWLDFAGRICSPTRHRNPE